MIRLLLAVMMLSGCNREAEANRLLWRETAAALEARLLNVGNGVSRVRQTLGEVTAEEAAQAASVELAVGEAHQALSQAKEALAAQDSRVQQALGERGAAQPTIADARKVVGALLDEAELKLDRALDTLESFERESGRRAEEGAVVKPEVDATKAGETVLTDLDFVSGLAVLDSGPATRASLVALADALKACPAIVAELEVHLAREDDARAAQQLSQQRAEALRTALTGEFLVAPKRLSSVKGFGFDRPVADESKAVTPLQVVTARSKNDRVVVRISKPCPAK